MEQFKFKEKYEGFAVKDKNRKEALKEYWKLYRDTAFETDSEDSEP